ncbi:MAG: DUF1634 domain-containing protein [Chlorobium sp.]|jgi:hypothetical protein|uniref:DUF1634 domain-containing protein n=1 Tax=Chlorobium sp. TaxID=1095 RepID=UPI001D957522|nr:DUF1634 domain-containing protein [Chlorobium sp.]MBN1279951.1 DUF1634 domain-containing protein [Chlorobiaceae bacterium]MCF8216637.1 DUF1634 domain-containing protein [Chlorobium sp.]MCF8271507.1 DUF1634 domain-containing protein [Chlorobium sp.]MCF8287879.1 DUF1634 domain-containing protein [Chlorobium sp.]MCF8291432.1 DUF1634 domain-containing protein [Chlorobium sp.]
MSNSTESNKPEIDRVQLVYASVLDVVSTAGMAMIAAGFLAYVLQLLPLTVSIEDIASHWHLRSGEMNSILSVPSGWSWVRDPLHGDVLSFVSIVFLSMAAMICLITVIPVFLSEKNRAYALIAILQVLVLAAAVAGLASGGN